MPAPTLTELAESVRPMDGVEVARQIALRERLVEVFVQARGLADEIEEILDDPWLTGRTSTAVLPEGK